MKAIYFDIETMDEGDALSEELLKDKVPSNYKNPEAIQKWINENKDKNALSPLTGKLLLGGFLVVNGEETEYIACWTEKSETDALLNILKTLQHFIDEGYLLVTFNGKEFDIPFLIQRCVINNIPNEYIKEDLLHKYKNYPHLDMKSYVDRSLAVWAYKLGLSKGFRNEAWKIADWIKEGEMYKIEEKNQEDLVVLRELHKRFKGWL